VIRVDTIATIMITNASHGRASAALFGKARRAVLALLFGHSGRSFYLREIARTTGLGVGPVQRELARLTGGGLLVRREIGNQVHYQANRTSPIFEELRGLMVKTAGVADVLKDALAPLSDSIELAFIYGSIAQGRETPSSDVDLMVIGDTTFGAVAAALRSAERTLGREVNPTVFPSAEISARIASGHPFVRNVLAGPRILLVGDQDGLAGLAT